ncbi:hypothetical protein D3C76_1289010 [compost metagenome]
MQTFQGRHAVGTQRIADGEQGRRFTVDRQQHWRRALRGLRSEFIIQRAGINAVFIEQCFIAEKQRMAIDLTTDA